MSSTATTLFLFILLPSLVSSHHHHHNRHLTDAAGKVCTSIATQDRSIPYDFCFTTLTKAKSPEPRKLADAAQASAVAGLDSILNDIRGREHRIRGDGRHGKCRNNFETVRSNLFDAVEEMYSGRSYGLAPNHLELALDYLQAAPSECERQLVGLSTASAAVTKQVETAIKIMLKILQS